MKRVINKRGDVPVTILVLGIVAVCILAILAFYISDNNIKKDFSTLNTVENAKIIGERVTFYGNLGYSNEEINNILGITDTGSERYYFITQGKISVKYNLPR